MVGFARIGWLSTSLVGEYLPFTDALDLPLMPFWHKPLIEMPSILSGVVD
jgi:hypothetical protein